MSLPPQTVLAFLLTKPQIQQIRLEARLPRLGISSLLEVDKADISKNGTFTIAPPTGWTFDTTGVTTLVTGGLVVDVMSQTPALLTP